MRRMTEQGIGQWPPGKVLINEEFSFEMKQWLTSLINSIPHVRTATVTLDPANISGNSRSTETITVNGVTTNDLIIVNKPTYTTGIDIVAAFASAANTVTLVFENTTGSAVDLGSEDYKVIAIRI